MNKTILIIIALVGIGCWHRSFAQTADEVPHRDEEGNWIPWYAPNPEGEGTRTTVDLRFAPAETKMIGPSPAAAGATRYGDYGVSYGLGLVQVGIPIYEIKTHCLTLPISLSYDAGGVRVEDVSGPVGLNWTLEAGGVITRTVIGRNDNDLNGWPTRPDGDPAASGYTNYTYLDSVAKGESDTAADLYTYSFCGHHGSFYVDWTTSPYSVIPTSATDLTIDVTTGGFLITDTDGTKYSFTKQETSSRFTTVTLPYSGGGAGEAYPQSSVPVTAWYLTEIAAMDRTDVITLNYTSTGTLITSRHFNMRTYDFTYHYQSAGSYLWMDASGQWGGYPAVSAQTGAYVIETGWTPTYLSSIVYDGGRVDFNYTANTSNPTNVRRSYPRILSNFTVKSVPPEGGSGTTVLTCTFTLPYQTSDKRNLLTGVAITGRDGAAVETYTLTYYNAGAGMDPDARDLFGYYNGASNSAGTAFLRLFEDNYTFYETVADRTYNANYVSYLSLASISTASGARTKFTYEGNGISASGYSDIFSTVGVGHRIKRIDTCDLSAGGETLVRRREFTYSSPGITFPLAAFNRSSFVTVSEVFREDLLNIHGWWCGPLYPMPRTATVAFSDQSVLPGAPLESARIYYGTVTERVSGPSGNSQSYCTEYTFNTSGAYHDTSDGSWSLGWSQDNHDDANNTYGTHIYHFYQRPPTSVPRQTAGPSVTFSPYWFHFQPADFPQLTAPTRIRRYKRAGSSDILVSQTTNVYDTTTEEYTVGVRVRNMIAPGDEQYMSSVQHVDDFYRENLIQTRTWHCLTGTTETEWLDDGSSRSASTSYAYMTTLSGIPSGNVVLSPKTKTLVIDGSSTDPRTYTWTYTYPSEQGSSAPWPALAAKGYRKPVTESVTAGTGTGAATTTRTETWASFTVKFATGTTILRPSSIATTREGPGQTGPQKGGPTVSYGAYDKWGNPVEISVDGQPTTTCIWGYGGLRPVLEVANGTYSDVSGAVNALSAIVNYTPTEQQLNTARTALEALSVKKLVSWYLYDLPFGMSQASDPSGRLTQYTYDGAGRLSYVQDESGNRISSYAYALTNGGSGSPNSINAYTHTAAGSSATAGIRDVAYFDGLGRNVQAIAVGASTSSKDLVTPVAPDFLDREDAKAYLPYPASSGTAGAFRSGALSAQQSYYGGSSVRAFTENTYELSSRGRVLSSSLPGFTDATTVATAGSAANTVRKLSYTPGTDNSPGTVSANGYYLQDRFTVTTTTGPDGSVTAVYTDEFGTPVLERVKIDASTWADTYYIKDVLGRVLCVVPPVETAKFSSTVTSIPAEYCYTYAYDPRDRVTERQLPGCAKEFITYNEADQPLTRKRLAAGSTSVDEVYTTTYDDFFRPTSETYKYGSGIAVTLAEYWYDSYPSGAPAFAAESGYVTVADTSPRTRSLKTAERFALLPANVAPSGLTSSNTATKESRAFYYDARGRVVQLARTNAQGGTDRISTKYKFTGDIEAQRQKIQPASGASTYNLDRAYTYDARLRLTNVTATLNGGATASQAIAYDDLQRTASVSRGNSASETTTFSYTLQGWLSSATSTSWLENLYYASPAHGATSAAPGKAGLVTEWKQQQLNGSGATTAETFAYTYDLAGRLKNSVRYLGTATTSDNKLTEQSISYNLDGNLTALTRRNASGTATETLSYSYTGPKRTNTGWTYDNHGNLTADPQSGMSVAWNAIDLPRTLTSGSASTSRGYLSDGTLAQIYDGSTTRLYVGDMVFTRTGTSGTPTLESAAWEGGRLINGSGTGNLLYYVTDHLGSVRVVKDGSGTVRQRFDYYPFGTVSRVYTSSSTTDYSLKRYRFGGKEIAGAALTELGGTGAAPGAPYLDFGARLYSPGTATWLSVDPMAEKYYGIGPLTYCAGNPVNLVDPTGMIFTERSGNYLEYLISYTKGQIKEQMSQITTLCKSLNDSNISDQIKGQIETMIDNARQLITDYSEALYEINVLKESSQVYDIYESSMYNTETHYGSGVSYNHSNGNFDIVIGIKNYSSLAHELKHAFQFDSGDFSSGHSAKGIPFYDLYDELDAYQRGALYGGDTRSLGSLASDPLYYKLQQKREGASLHPLYPASRWQQISNKYQSVFRINGVLYVPNN